MPASAVVAPIRTLAGLTGDVSIGTPAANALLVYNGSRWVNIAVALAGVNAATGNATFGTMAASALTTTGAASFAGGNILFDAAGNATFGNTAPGTSQSIWLDGGFITTDGNGNMVMASVLASGSAEFVFTGLSDSTVATGFKFTNLSNIGLPVFVGAVLASSGDAILQHSSGKHLLISVAGADSPNGAPVAGSYGFFNSSNSSTTTLVGGAATGNPTFKLMSALPTTANPQFGSSDSTGQMGWIQILSTGNVSPTFSGSGSSTSMTLNGPAASAPAGSQGQLQYINSSTFAGMGSSSVSTSGNLLTITAGAGTDVPVTLAGSATATQTGALLQFYVSVGGNPLMVVQPAAAAADSLVRANASNNAINLVSLYGTGTNSAPGISWTASDNNAAKSKAGVWSSYGVSGSFLYLGTSNAFASGVTSAGLTIDPNGQVGVFQTVPTSQFHVVSRASSTIAAKLQAAASQSADIKQTLASDGTTVYNRETPLGWIQNTQCRKRNTADVTNATATMANIGDCSMTLAAGRKYTGLLTLIAANSTAAEGLQFDCGGGSATFSAFESGFAATPPGSGLVLGTLTAGNSTTALTATTATTADAVYTVIVTMVVGAAGGGTFIPRFSEVSHTSGTATLRLGSFAWLEDSPN